MIDDKAMAGNEEGIAPVQKKEFKLKMLIPPGQKVPVGIAS
jgi:hypothetical protein